MPASERGREPDEAIASGGDRGGGGNGAVALAETMVEARPVNHLPTRRPRTRGRGSVHTEVLASLAAYQEDLSEHSREVAALAGGVAQRLGLGPAEVGEVVQTAELHDVGKLALPVTLLEKPGPLDEEEWWLMRLHTVAGERILADMPEAVGLGRLVRSTHERWDGNGYPDGLAGEEIPLVSRVVFACDAVDAMTSSRSYGRARTAEEALEELERCAGTQFDPKVVEALVEELVQTRRAPRAEDAGEGRGAR